MSINSPYSDIAQLPGSLPVFPLTGAVLLPRGELPLNIFEPRYVAMVDAAIASNRLIGMIQPLPGGDGATVTPRLFQVGCAGRLTRFSETGDGRYLVTLSGISRFRLGDELPSTTPYRQFHVSYDGFEADLLPGAGESAVDREAMVGMLRNFADYSKLEIDWASIDAAPTETLVNALAMMSPFGANEKQALIEAIDLKTRAETLVTLAKLDMALGDGEGQQWH
ncbi:MULTISPECIES: LON peptidase substrate-binding domain-containing protein [Methylocystis]|uniref:ATP-dependent protease n=1 Tax=Methylocystis iwaonis TaxID=2885079 RepID=A0ABM8E831_9HYPH|nr:MULTISPECIES: LON peptidase substrate-binding domain-containing protein [Methylocystis]MBL1257226.1 LON peptidase substrate-binding domain-containing protein [Methylocystis sp. Sn-Cys]MDJ0448418.1 LON peptidase substrate-binding domain-containing protein [Methylocystis sp. JR02]BDV34020.1 ATP-dependent protease [Methylocystis iwaonis]